MDQFKLTDSEQHTKDLFYRMRGGAGCSLKELREWEMVVRLLFSIETPKEAMRRLGGAPRKKKGVKTKRSRRARRRSETRGRGGMSDTERASLFLGSC